MIKAVEQALIERLRLGLGDMVTTVASYGGEFDNTGLAQAVNCFPACWVAFGGITDTVPSETRRRRYRVSTRYVVLVADRAYGSEADSRLGSLHEDDVGSYRLLRAVRHLLAAQTLGLSIAPICPKSAKSLFNQEMEGRALSVFAAEFETFWYEQALEDGEWPEYGSGGTLDYGGRGQTPAPFFQTADLQVRATPKTLADPADTEAVINTLEHTK